MAAEKITLEVQTRTAQGSRAAKRLRRAGVIPGVVYGGEGGSLPIVVEETVLRAALTGEHGRHAILHVTVDGGPERPSILKAWQSDPVRTRLRHVDLQEIRLDRPIQGAVTILLVGESAGVKLGGALAQMTHQVHVEALPATMPDRLELDITDLDVGGHVRIADIVLPKGVTLLDDPETMVATVAATPRSAGEDWHEVEDDLGGESGEAATDAGAADDTDAS